MNDYNAALFEVIHIVTEEHLKLSHRYTRNNEWLQYSSIWSHSHCNRRAFEIVGDFASTRTTIKSWILWAILDRENKTRKFLASNEYASNSKTSVNTEQPAITAIKLKSYSAAIRHNTVSEVELIWFSDRIIWNISSWSLMWRIEWIKLLGRQSYWRGWSYPYWVLWGKWEY